MWRGLITILLLITSALAGSATPKLVEVKGTLQNRLVVSPTYFEQKLLGSSAAVLVRPEVLIRLIAAAESLPEGYSLVIKDGYRSRLTQFHIYNRVYETLLRQHREFWPKKKLERKLDQLTLHYVADPTEPAPPHLTGGAVDVVLLYQGEPVDLGAAFDAITERARTDFFDFKSDEHSRLVAENRAVLIEAMSRAGFVNYSGEYWHWEYGTVLWGKIKKTREFIPFDAIENCGETFEN